MNTIANPSDHEWFSEQIATYLANGLRGEELTRFESHATACAACAQEFSHARNLEREMTALFPDAIPTSDLEDRLIRRLRFSDRGRFHPIVRRVAVAAAAAIMLGGLGLIGQQYLMHEDRLSLASVVDRVRAASNLSQIGQGMLLYSNENKGAYARPASTAPSSNAEWQFGGGLSTSLNWSDRSKQPPTSGLSDNYQDPYPSQPAPAGNVAYGDKHVEFQSTPFKASDQDGDALGRRGFSLQGQNTFGGETNVDGSQTIAGKYFRPSDEITGTVSADRGEALVKLQVSDQNGDENDAGRKLNEAAGHFYFASQDGSTLTEGRIARRREGSAPFDSTRHCRDDFNQHHQLPQSHPRRHDGIRSR